MEAPDGWKTIEVISEGDRPEGSSWTLPGSMVGLNTFLVDDGNTLRILVNHELHDAAAISEINLDKGRLTKAIANIFRSNSVGGVEFVKSSQMAYDQWSRNNGQSWRTRVNPGETSFCTFFSSQSYDANTFGADRGFADRVHITGEKCEGGRLFALKSSTRELYQISGITGHVEDVSDAGGMPFDSFEGAALIDTGDTEHVALMLSANGGTWTSHRLYVGRKGVNEYGQRDREDNFLSRNGLMYGEWYYLGNLSSTGAQTWSGELVTESSGSFGAEKVDIMTNPSNPRQVAVTESNGAAYIFDFDFAFGDVEGGPLIKKEQSRFTVMQISGEVVGGGSLHPNGLDSTAPKLRNVKKGNDDGRIWHLNVNGQEKESIGRTRVDGSLFGALDISHLLNYPPSMVMLVTKDGKPSSMTLLLNPELGILVSSQIAEDEAEPPDDGSTCPLKSSPEMLVVQAEEADLLVDASIHTTNGNFCGDGYIVFGDAPDAGIKFNVDIVSAGSYEVSIRYSNGGAAGIFRPGSFHVDYDGQKDDFIFPTSSNWSIWKTETKIVAFNRGRHTLEIWWSSEDLRPNLDWMSVKLVDDARPL
jgi:Carbohydrate binding module (family 6)